MIFLEGEPSAGLWLVENGRIKAYKLSPDGQEYILRFFGPGETFNDLAALDGSPNAASTTAVTDVAAWVIPTAVFRDLLAADHQLCLAVIQGLNGARAPTGGARGGFSPAPGDGPPGPLPAGTG
jgi:CRP-like cAMP-binding protein